MLIQNILRLLTITSLVLVMLSGCDQEEPEITEVTLPVSIYSKPDTTEQVKQLFLPEKVSDPFSNLLDANVAQSAIRLSSLRTFNPYDYLMDDADLKVRIGRSLDRTSALISVESDYFVFNSFTRGGYSLVVMGQNTDLYLDTSRIDLNNRKALAEECPEHKPCHGVVYFSIEVLHFNEDVVLFLIGISPTPD